MISASRTRLNKRIGEAIFLSAQRDYVTGDLQRVTSAARIGNILAAVILTTPVLMLLAGLMFAFYGWPNILALIIATILIGVGWWLFPRREKVPVGCLDRTDMPKTFALLDQISAQMEAPQITKLLLIDDFQAAVTVIRKERILIIGALLWASMKDDQKLAIIAHEIGHLANNDPTRGGFIGAAIGTLEGWHTMFSQTVATNEYGEVVLDSSSNIIGDLIADSLRTIVELIWTGLERVSFLPQQRAEYLADALSAELAGRAACIEALEQTELADRIGLEVAGLGSRNLPDGMDMIRRLARPITNASAEDRDTVRANMRAADHMIDRVHPPTAFRIAFIELLPIEDAKLTPADLDFAGADAELEPYFAQIGTSIAQSLMVQ